jgi:hypothetical protein
MSIAEKLVTIAENQEKVFDAGKQAEYDRFWDELQNYGKSKGYPNAFSYTMWNDKTYNPKYTFKVSGCNNMFMSNTNITDTKVPIDFRGNGGQIFGLFNGCTKLVTIRTLILDATKQTFNNYFLSCKALKNITFEGEIIRDIDFSYSPLSVDSMKNVIGHLAKFVGTENELSYTVTFTDECWAALEADSHPDSGGLWRDYVTYGLGWNT